MDKELDQQNKTGGQVQEEIERAQEERPIHIQIKDGNYKQRKSQRSSRKVETASLRHWTYGEIFSVAILHE